MNRDSPPANPAPAAAPAPPSGDSYRFAPDIAGRLRQLPSTRLDYPADITKEEFERWVAAHPEDKEAFQAIFTVIRQEGGRLVAVPYARYYQAFLTRAAGKLREAAEATANASLIEERKADVRGVWNILYAIAPVFVAAGEN